MLIFSDRSRLRDRAFVRWNAGVRKGIGGHRVLENRQDFPMPVDRKIHPGKAGVLGRE